VPRRVWGSSLAAIVSAIEISKTEKVVWVQTSSHLAGHFMGTQIEEAPIDVGMVALEPFNGGSNQRIFTNIPPIRQTGIPFVQIGFDWLKSQGEEFLEIPVSVSFFGEIIPDHLIADNLHALRQIDSTTGETILREIKKLNAFANENSSLHPRNKNTSTAFLNHSLKEIFLATVGPAFYEALIEPWLARFNRGIAEILPARDHRTAWVPLFYPESIEQVFVEDDLLTSMSKTFIIPKSSSISGLISRLIAKVHSSNVEITSIEEYDYLPVSGDIMLTNTSDIMKLLSQEFGRNYSELFEIPITVLVLHFNGFIANELILNVIENEIGPYRVCVRNIDFVGQKTIITLEFGEDFAFTDDNEIMTAGLSWLERLNLPTSYSSFKIKRAKIKVPYGLSREMIESDRTRAYEIMRQNGIIGFPIDFGSSAFNDQILLGLWSVHVARESR
jgi:hypothetical protein